MNSNKKGKQIAKLSAMYYCGFGLLPQHQERLRINHDKTIHKIEIQKK